MEWKTPTRRQFLRRTPAAASLPAARSVHAAQPAITIDATRPGPRVSPSLYGIFFEEINHAGDGGLYAEMVRDRSFADSGSNPAWTLRTSGGAPAQRVS